ncbi:MAG TPA: toll/interleukin-1 receptor domain-containing protein [Pyrinomonadaceae bacterium]|nr:toll/interleukin-1 receptor domain-containing protein [Pyrinomonadaceae bacterium]
MTELYTQSHPLYTSFISYSRRDEPFVGYLREWLTWHGVPSWFAPQDMRQEEFQSSEAELERDLYTYVDEAERVLLVISPNILPSGWVGKEVQRARHRTALIPILIETMPHPDSLEWRALIAKTVDDVPYTQLNPDEYSEQLKKLLAGYFFDFRNWREPSVLAQTLPTLLPFLTRTPQPAEPGSS